MIFEAKTAASTAWKSASPDDPFPRKWVTENCNAISLPAATGFHGICRTSIPAALCKFYDRDIPSVGWEFWAQGGRLPRMS